MTWLLQHLIIASAALVVIAVLITLAVFRMIHHVYPHESTRPQFAAALVSLSLTVLFSVFLNNLFATKRERDTRYWSLQDQHFTQLKATLRTESEKLQALAKQIEEQGHVASVTLDVGFASADPGTLLWPDVMSPDLRNHFPAYERTKHELLDEVNIQDREFKDLLAAIQTRLKPPVSSPYWRDIISVSVVEQCIGHGNGITLSVSANGYSFDTFGGGGSNSGGGPNPPRPSPDQVAAYGAYKSLRVHPIPEMVSHCTALKTRAQNIADKARSLSTEALLLAQGTALTGSCEFVNVDRDVP